jgi:hypothetical protein
MSLQGGMDWRDAVHYYKWNTRAVRAGEKLDQEAPRERRSLAE